MLIQVPARRLSPEALLHVSAWPARLTEIGRVRGMVTFRDQAQEFEVGFTFAQIEWHARSATAGALVRLIEAELASVRAAHELGGHRMIRTPRSPTSVVKPALPRRYDVRSRMCRG